MELKAPKGNAYSDFEKALRNSIQSVIHVEKTSMAGCFFHYV